MGNENIEKNIKYVRIVSCSGSVAQHSGLRIYTFFFNSANFNDASGTKSVNLYCDLPGTALRDRLEGVCHLRGRATNAE